MGELAHVHKRDSTSASLGMPFAAAFLRDGYSVSPVSFGDLRIAPLSKEGYSAFLEAVALEIGRRYPETGEPYARELLTLSGTCGTTSLSRKIIIGCYMPRELVGFTVATPKQGRRVKFGPTVVFRRFRGLGIASLLRSAGERHFAQLGFEYAYSTCREDNYPARSYVIRSNYHLVGRLEGHYSLGVAELVYAKRLPARSDISFSTVLPAAKFSESSPYLLKRKRGGAARIVLSKAIFQSPKQFSEVLAYTIEGAQREGIRRVYLKIPATPILTQAAMRLDLRAESYGLPDYSFDRAVVVARSFER